MKTYIFSILLSLSCFTVAIGQTRADVIRKKVLSKDTTSVLVVAHRGHWRFATENSLLGIENSIKIGVDIVEIDIQRTKDGHLILMHDETVDRTTTGKGRVDTYTLDSIKKLKLKSGVGIRTNERVPTLEEVLELSKGRILLNLDKADRYIDQVYELLKKTGTTKYVVMKTDKPFVDVRVQFHSYLFDAILMPIINLNKEYAESELDAYLSFLKPAMVELVYKDDSNPLPKEMKERLRGKSLIWYNTLWDTLAGGHDDDLALISPDKAYGYLIDTLGANVIQTDRPLYLLEYLRGRNLHD